MNPIVYSGYFDIERLSLMLLHSDVLHCNAANNNS